MAGTIRVNLSGNYTNGLTSRAIPQRSISVVQTNQEEHCPIVTVGTSEEDLSLGDISGNGWIILHNLDATNFVTYGPKDTTMTAFGRIEAGEFAVLRLEPSVILRWIADTAPVKVKVEAFGD